ncbi:Uma2 family endonuclease [Streptomyces sp. ICBB 8177]|uniref:Uma2 family endonuclease n=1 Tax=Streptomyces sp. ICBB 8177 TaxID=563922 RepID=UPI000D67A5AC|nr:Uma2 family endonuclease [Streptomyces sp. ICBB 8177]PWI44002.1 hypothetical protein CK485_18315 [Streptomyces sp. ICBB 8177]
MTWEGAVSTTLDEMFELIEAMNVPEGYRAEIIEGEIVLNPQRATHATIIRKFTRALEAARGEDAPILWDVRVDFPGTLNGYAPDVTLVADNAAKALGGRYGYRDVELVAEVVSYSSKRDDYGSKLDTYAAAGVPEYVIVDPRPGLVHVFSEPRDGTYRETQSYPFGISFVLPVSQIPLDTANWPRD